MARRRTVHRASLDGYRDYYRYSIWGPVSRRHKFYVMLRHALGLEPCYRRGKPGAYCPCYWTHHRS